MRVPWIGALILVWSLSLRAQTWLPQGGPPGEIVTHTAYTLSYNSDHLVANWVSHALRPEHLKDCVGRMNGFSPDPDLRSHSASSEDYARSGYDRGHLAPAGDMKWSAQVMKESFYMTNVSPQTPSMNRGRWLSLETLVRAWAKASQEVLVVTGPVLEQDLPQMGPSRVSIPRYHFKVILRTVGNQRQAIGFLMPQAPGPEEVKAFALPVRKIEELTGLDFFPHIPKLEQDSVEKEIAWQLWDFKATFSYSSCGA